MAVLIEGISVVVLNDAVARIYPGGVSAFERAVPNSNFCSDGELLRVGFMAPPDVQAYVEELEAKGLQYRDANRLAVNIVVVDQRTGFLISCSWATFDRVPLDNDPKRIVSVCSMPKSKVNGIARPPDWQYDTSLSANFRFVETDQVAGDLEFVRREGAVDVYRDRKTGVEYYVGRTR